MWCGCLASGKWVRITTHFTQKYHRYNWILISLLFNSNCPISLYYAPVILEINRLLWGCSGNFCHSCPSPRASCLFPLATEDEKDESQTWGSHVLCRHGLAQLTKLEWPQWVLKFRTCLIHFKFRVLLVSSTFVR